MGDIFIRSLSDLASEDLGLFRLLYVERSGVSDVGAHMVLKRFNGVPFVLSLEGVELSNPNWLVNHDSSESCKPILVDYEHMKPSNAWISISKVQNGYKIDKLLPERHVSKALRSVVESEFERDGFGFHSMRADGKFDERLKSRVADRLYVLGDGVDLPYDLYCEPL